MIPSSIEPSTRQQLIALLRKCQALFEGAEYTAPGIDYNPHLEKEREYDILIPVSLLRQSPGELRNLNFTHQDPLTARLGLILRETAQIKILGTELLDKGSIFIGLSFSPRVEESYLYSLFLTDGFTQVSLDKIIREESGADSPSLLKTRDGTDQDLMFFNQLSDLIPPKT